MATTWCVPLREVRQGDLSRVGGKASNLGELMGAGFDVPAGFVVTTEAFRVTVGEASTLKGIEASKISGGLETSIRRAYAELGGGPVAVRSSATAEDLPGAAFAGQQDTHLEVDGSEEVISAIRNCWASLFSERAIAYRERLRIDSASVSMGVVVQRMVAADAAGVMFTAEPVTGARDRVVVNASRGLGEAVVSGTVTPDHFVIDAGYRFITKRQGQDEPVAGGGVGGVSFAVSEAVLVELAATGRRIAEHFQRPQDIEWAVQGGRLFIVQSRAMTALPPAPIVLSRAQRQLGPVLLELLPRRPLPMELTAGIRPIFAKHVLGLASGLAGIAVDYSAALPERDAIVQEFVPPRPRPTWHTPARLVRTVLRGMKGSPGQWRSDARFVEFRRGVAQLEATDLTGLSWAQLVTVPDRAGQLVDVMTQLRVVHLPSALGALAKLWVSQLVSRNKATMRDVLTASTTVTRLANDELAAMAVEAGGNFELGELIRAADVHQLEEAARSTPAIAQWLRRFEDFLAMFGHRETTSILLLHDPSWKASPGTVLGLVRMLLDEDDVPQTPTAAAHTAGAEMPAWQRSLVRKAADAVALREDTHFELTRVMPALRRAILEMGRRLADADELDDAEDVWMLTLDEVRAWPRSDAAFSVGLRTVAARRAMAYAELASNPLIATTTLYPKRKGSASALVLGTGSGSGRATGRVRIIGGPGEFGNLRTGEVLVCSATNPSWTPLFQRAAALVVDHGGLASHAAIVAREYGIPAVMGAATATTTLRDGQLVTVDGDRGEVIEAKDGS